MNMYLNISGDDYNEVKSKIIELDKLGVFNNNCFNKYNVYGVLMKLIAVIVPNNQFIKRLTLYKNDENKYMVFDNDSASLVDVFKCDECVIEKNRMNEDNVGETDWSLLNSIFDTTQLQRYFNLSFTEKKIIHVFLKYGNEWITERTVRFVIISDKPVDLILHKLVYLQLLEVIVGKDETNTRIESIPYFRLKYCNTSLSMMNKNYFNINSIYSKFRNDYHNFFGYHDSSKDFNISCNKFNFNDVLKTIFNKNQIKLYNEFDPVSQAIVKCIAKNNNQWTIDTKIKRTVGETSDTLFNNLIEKNLIERKKENDIVYYRLHEGK